MSDSSITLSKLDAKILSAYVECFGETDGKSSLELLETARFNLKGEYENLKALAKAHLKSTAAASLYGYSTQVNQTLLDEMSEKFVGHDGWWFWRNNKNPE